MRHLMPLLALICCLWNEVASNPIPVNPFKEIGITEVYSTSSTDWNIELDGTVILLGSGSSAFPSSAKVYLRFKSPSYTTATFPARVSFAKNGFGVISQKSPHLMPLGRLMTLWPRDTVKVALDSTQLSTSAAQVNYWSFALRNVSPGNALVAIRNYNDSIGIYETSRKSIGSAGNYVTRYSLTLLDKYNRPLPDIAVGTNMTNSNGTYQREVSIRNPGVSIAVSDPLGGHPNKAEIIPKRYFSYIDADSLIEDTVKVNMTHYLVTAQDPLGNPPGVNCYQKLTPINATYSPPSRKLWLWNDSLPNTWLLRIYESLPVDTLCFSDFFPDSNTVCRASWSGSYVDTPSFIRNIVTIDQITASKTPHYSQVNSGVAFTVLCANKEEIRISISSPLASVEASIALYTISGRKIKAQPVYIHNSGTIGAFLKFRKGELPSGTYLCRLTIDGYSPVARSINVP